MRHVSIPSGSGCQLLNFTPLNPLISKCQIKVCYVGEDPNRNGSVITKEVATTMAVSLPGCPIVGFYNEAKGDFEEHNKIIDISNGKFAIKDTTRPYGFVSMDARVWFQKFIDDDIEHEYLMTEGYVWTEVYPESKRILAGNNGQSMELSNQNLKGSWTADDNGNPQFFIINEALISKLCILGEDVEPCFEGASITGQFSLSLDDDFKTKLFTMMQELKDVLDKGGTTKMENDLNNPTLETEKEPETDFKKNPEEEEKKKPVEGEEGQEKNKDSEEDKKGKEKTEPEDKSKDPEDKDEDEKKKKKFSYDTLEEIPEYVELNNKFNQLSAQNATLLAELEPLRAFKVTAERTAKEEMIKGFYMLSDADKKDCVDNIDQYSLDDIEAKLSIICVRNKVQFNLDEDTQEKPANPTVYTLGDNDDGDAAPAWIKAVRDTANKQI